MTLEELIQRIVAMAEAGRTREALDTYKMALVALPRHPALVQLLPRLPQQYDDAFYANTRPNSLRSAKIMLAHLVSLHRPKTVVDFGAGTGTWLEAAVQYGAETALAIEGEWVRSSVHRFAGAHYQYQDLNDPIRIDQRFDLAISVEVAEHLQSPRGPSFVDDLCRASDCVMFAAALPRQGGDGHINCRPHSYWAREFERNGYACLDAFRPKVWYDPGVEPWYAQNTYLFVRAGHPLQNAIPVAALLDVYHPLITNEYVMRDHLGGSRDPG